MISSPTSKQKYNPSQEKEECYGSVSTESELIELDLTTESSI